MLTFVTEHNSFDPHCLPSRLTLFFINYNNNKIIVPSKSFIVPINLLYDFYFG